MGTTSLLKSINEPMTVRQIADELGNEPESIRLTLKRMQEKHKVELVSKGTWGLPQLD